MPRACIDAAAFGSRLMPGYLQNMVGGLAAEDSLPIPAMTHHVKLPQALGMRGGYRAVQFSVSTPAAGADNSAAMTSARTRNFRCVSSQQLGRPGFMPDGYRFQCWFGYP